MRIVGGKFRGRALVTPESSAIRPTSDRTRESLFNIISHGFREKLDNTRVLDLFAGTGALGLEAMSRGCRYTVFVENPWRAVDYCARMLRLLAFRGIQKYFVAMRRR